ncbi:hypothetical protein [Bradyrhizobium sp. SYSU BS000235]|uniref:hypothetical protein n=1 Tax=Bradyrhizobium sp. SYSU BS000235 TaxID=3411332 RepID=UPI003C79574E
MSNSGNPVVKALASAQQETWNQNEAAVERAVSDILHPVFPSVRSDEDSVTPVISAFAAWCEMMNVRSCPARPAVLAAFVVDLSASMPAADLMKAVMDIADWHLLYGLANPAATPIVLAALNEIAAVEAPRSWPKKEKHRFHALPHDLQVYIAKREKERDLVLRRAQNAAAGSRRKHADDPAHTSTDVTADAALTETT